MRINCSCCLELLTPADELSSTPCGHVLHTPCLLQWLETNRVGTCPQCRQKCRESDLRRVYFSEGMDTTLSMEEDSGVLQNKLDGIKFSLRCSETEKKKALLERDEFKEKNAGLKEEVRKSERRRQEAKDELLNARTQMRYVQAEKEMLKKAKEEVEELKRKLQLYESIDIIVKGSQAEVNDRLHDMGDFSRASKELNIIIHALKRELKAQKEEQNAFKQEARSKARLVSDLKEKLVVASRQVQELSNENRTLASDLRHAEDERGSLKKKVSTLQDALDSPSGDARGSVINRMMAEYPAPMQKLEMDSDVEDEKVLASDGSPFLKTKSCSIVGLNKRKLTPCEDSTNYSQMNIMRKPRIGASSLSKDDNLSAACSQSSSSAAEAKSKQKFYDGFGGHSKEEVWSSRSRDGFKPPAKRPKGISRPKAVVRTASSKAIDKFFNFDTP